MRSTTRAAAAAAIALLGARALAARPPSVLLLSVDTLRADHLGCYGYPRATSPRMDALLARGARFSQARTVEPLTAPALASLVTGIDPHEHAATRNGLRMRADLMSFPKIFKRRGYETAAYVGNWTLRDRISGLGEHFEEYYEVLDKHRWLGVFKGEATAEDLTDRALAWLDEWSDEGRAKPFLLWVHYVEPHAPYELQSDFAAQVGEGAAGDRRYRYDTEIAFADHHIGRLVDGVGELLPDGELVTVLVADHGESLGEHDYWGHGRHLFDATLHVPMGILWPGRIAPAVVAEPALITDLAPTLLSLAGLPVPGFYSGRDWSPTLLAGEPPAAGRVTHYQAHRGAVQRRDAPQRVREQGLLEVARLAGGRKEILRITNGRRRVFDVHADPAESRSQVADDSPPSADLQAWLRVVRQGLQRSDEEPPPALDDEDLEALRDLGYVD
ncbi:MAG: sulfatase [Acidobacteriota bacterium]|nr:sulfatase [Acidobacteriota bacterium]MDH3524970.1 sulfatase [Acidobacteriota bacterium]